MALLVTVFNVLIRAILLGFLLRAVLSWFQDGSGDFISTAYEVACTFTEPFVIPVRSILDRLGIGKGSPLDLSFMITYMLIVLIDMIL